MTPVALALLVALLPPPSPAASTPPANGPVVVLETTRGTVKVALDAQKAPKSVANFLRYVKEHHFDGTVFHRVIPGFMIQGGGMDATLEERPTHAPIANESGNGLHNARGTIAMARTNDPDSATSQFFINVADNTQSLDPAGRPGYAVFGRVIEGMDVVDAIVAVPTATRGAYQNVPMTPVVIKSARLLGAPVTPAHPTAAPKPATKPGTGKPATGKPASPAPRKPAAKP